MNDMKYIRYILCNGAGDIKTFDIRAMRNDPDASNSRTGEGFRG